MRNTGKIRIGHIVNSQLLPQRLPTISIFPRSSIDTVATCGQTNVTLKQALRPHIYQGAQLWVIQFICKLAALSSTTSFSFPLHLHMHQCFVISCKFPGHRLIISFFFFGTWKKPTIVIKFNINFVAFNVFLLLLWLQRPCKTQGQNASTHG